MGNIREDPHGTPLKFLIDLALSPKTVKVLRDFGYEAVRGQASDLGGFCVEDFMKLLSARGVSVINWDVAELAEELKHADSF